MKIINGDCRDAMKGLADCSADSIVTDPPYELGFMGKGWDRSGIAYDVKVWIECLRVLKPGGYLLAFGGDRTFHRMVCAIEDAGFEIRGTITWLFGSGFPKSLNVSQRLKDSLPADAQCVCDPRSRQTVLGSQGDYQACHGSDGGRPQTAEDSGLSASPLSADVRARSRDGRPADGQGVLLTNTFSDEGNGHHSTCYSPPQISASENSLSGDSALSDMAANKSSERLTAGHRTVTGTQRTPRSVSDLASFSSPEVYANLSRCARCNKYEIRDGIGTALKPAAEYITMARRPLIGTVAENVLMYGTGGLNIDGCRIATSELTPRDNKIGDNGWKNSSGGYIEPSPLGRWPANVIHDGSDEVLAGFPDTDHACGSNGRSGVAGVVEWSLGPKTQTASYVDNGSAARFFYCAKASQEDRDEGLEELARRQRDEGRKEGNPGGDNPRNRGLAPRSNHHPTVKPTDLMRYLCRLVTPPHGTVLDPFCGSGSTGKAAVMEGLEFIGIELSAEYCELAEKRINAASRQGLLFSQPASALSERANQGKA